MKVMVVLGVSQEGWGAGGRACGASRVRLLAQRRLEAELSGRPAPGRPGPGSSPPQPCRSPASPAPWLGSSDQWTASGSGHSGLGSGGDDLAQCEPGVWGGRVPISLHSPGPLSPYKRQRGHSTRSAPVTVP